MKPIVRLRHLTARTAPNEMGNRVSTIGQPHQRTAKTHLARRICLEERRILQPNRFGRGVRS